MKDQRRGIFSISIRDKEYFYNKQEKIELVSCSHNGIDCQGHRSVINKKYVESRKFLFLKDYSRSIEELRGAFYKANELQENSCSNCAELFRSTIIQSLEGIHDDLNKMSNGWLRPKRYQSSFEMAQIVLEEFKQANKEPHSLSD